MHDTFFAWMHVKALQFAYASLFVMPQEHQRIYFRETNKLALKDKQCTSWHQGEGINAISDASSKH